MLEVARNPNNVRVPGHTVVGGVDLATGQLGLTYTDASIKGRGLSLEFTRSYNQGTANVFNPAGLRLATQLPDAARPQPGACGVHRLSAGVPGSDFPEKDGAQNSLPPFHTTLVDNDDGSFDYFDKAHVKYHFPGALERDSFGFYRQSYVGNLDYIEEPNMNRIELFYDQHGRLEKAMDSSGRLLTFEYEPAAAPFVGVVVPALAGLSSESCIPDGTRFPMIRDQFVKSDVGRAWRITKITGPGGLEIEYLYDLEGNLKTVTRKGTDGMSLPAGADYRWDYEYRPAGITAPVDIRHILSQITDPNRESTIYEYLPDNIALPLKAIRYPENVSTSFDFAPPQEVQFTSVK